MSRIVHDGPLIIGGGLAGLSAALAAAPRPVLVISPAPLLEAASSAWAQGGVAAALSRDDAPALHLKDTEAAGAGLVDHPAAEVLTDEGRSTVEWLASLGAPFDRDAAGEFSVSLEAAHSMARVARVGGDGAGRAIQSALVASAGYRQAFDAAGVRYRAGLGNLVDFEDARRTAVQADTALAELRRDRLLAWISLYRAAGGGWESPPPPVRSSSGASR